MPRVGRTIQVTREPGLEIDATISPDGKLVAYAAGPRGATRIYVKQVAGGRPVSLSDGLDEAHRFPRWSPDGMRISFEREWPESWETYVVPALGGAPRRFPATGAFELVWSPHGERIAYLTETAIFVGPADEGAARKLADADDPSCLSWSPDGMRLAFTSGNSNYLYNLNAAPSSIWVVDVEGGEPVRVMEDEHLSTSPVWTGDGRSLLFVSDRGGGRDIYRLSVDPAGHPTGAPERLTTGLDVFTISSSADGRMLSYSVATSRQNVWSLLVPEDNPVSVKAAVPVTSGNQRVTALDVSADGRWLAFDSDSSGDPDLFRMPVEGGEPIQITLDPAMDFSPRWSPDGTEIAFHSFRTGNRDIFVVSSDGGAVRQLTSDPAHEFNPHWSPDGKRVAFDSDRSGVRNEIYVLSRDGGELSGETPLQLTFDGGMAPRWSPDESLIAYYHPSGVKVIPSEGGEPRRLTDFGSRPIWSKDGQTLYFGQSAPNERAGIWSVSSSGGEPKLLVRFDDPTRQFYPGWSSDGEHFYFTLTEFEADVWVMELQDSK